MRKSHVIEWQSSINGRTGRGTKTFELEEAERLAAELNREYPKIHHFAVEMNLPELNRESTEESESGEESQTAAAV